MTPSGHRVEVKNLSHNATEKDLYDFFSFCGAIQHVEIIRAAEHACTAYVTFKNSHAAETAVLISGTNILDQPVSVTYLGYHEDDHNPWNHYSWKIEDESSFSNQQSQGCKGASSAGGAMSLAQNVVKTAVSKGYMLGKGAFNRAKAFDDSHQVSATAASKITNVSDRIGLTDKIFYGVEAARSVNQKYRISDTTKSAVSATGRTAVSAANTVASSTYFSRGALWISGALNRASLAAAELGSRGANK
ncbi:binding partner of ACD11 1 isoform X2 [Andrographis paniculata]|uniref:binding partner of ACD11 1 isoform X2 n=1 Tax=Andrographis paniculata TaxID=175694 RepID=UPI0021E9625B|nr:binding partner of ACD11 1 isoform X2 [Andrographis paniculata]